MSETSSAGALGQKDQEQLQLLFNMELLDLSYEIGIAFDVLQENATNLKLETISKTDWATFVPDNKRVEDRIRSAYRKVIDVVERSQYSRTLRNNILD